MIRFEADRARGWYATGLRLMPLLDPRSAASAGAMAGIYRRLLERISAQPAAVLQTRLSLTTGEKAMVAVRSLAGMTRPATRDAAGDAVMSERRVVVIGGGLAGITAAIALREAGAAVTLLEARPRLGGATTSFRRGELAIDNGQHVFLALLHRLPGAARPARGERRRRRCRTGSTSPCWRRGGPARLRRTQLPGPLHLGKALATYRLLSLAERAGSPGPRWRMRFLDPADPAIDEQRLGDWLAAHGQGERARRALWDLFTVSA